jgi:hypothetical protein
MDDRFHRACLLAFVTGIINQELLLRKEYLSAENRILKAHLPSRLRSADAKRTMPAEIAKRLGATLCGTSRARPETIIGWYRRLIARKFDGSRQRGRPRCLPRQPMQSARLPRFHDKLCKPFG